VSSKWDKVVILKHMFTLQELEEDPAAMLEIKEDIREECAKLGEVTNVVLFDKEPQGVARVRFKDAQAAEACVKVSCGCRSSTEGMFADGVVGHERSVV
jgi:HIV Tat-specific factor 1